MPMAKTASPAKIPNTNNNPRPTGFPSRGPKRI
jgi:hypothetical protein